MNDPVNEWMNERMKKWMSGGMDGWMSEWTNKQTNKWMSERMNESTASEKSLPFSLLVYTKCNFYFPKYILQNLNNVSYVCFNLD